MAKRPTKPRKVTQSQSYVGASVTLAETNNVRSFSQRTKDWELVSRGIQMTVYAASNLNATACAHRELKLYRPAKGASRSPYKGRKVTSRDRLAWLKGDKSIGPGRKAATMGSLADDIEQVMEHPVLDLLYRPDPFIVGSQWRWLAYFFSEVCGRAFFYKGERVGGVPSSLYLLAPQYINVVGSKSRFIAGYDYAIDPTQPAHYLPEDVIYYRERVHPFRPLQAMSWLQAMTAQSDLEAAALAAEIARWNNGGQPGMVISVNDSSGKTTPDQVRQAENEFNSKHQGVANSGRTMFLLNSVLTQYGSKPHEMQYVPGMERMETAIYRAAGIPEPVWKMASSNRASAEAADPQWMGSTINPKLCMFAETMTEELLPEYKGTDGWWFAYDNPVSEDRTALEVSVFSASDKGIITGNEARSKLGWDLSDDPLLDVHRFNGTPLSAPQAQPDPNAAPDMANPGGDAADGQDAAEGDDTAESEAGKGVAEDGAKSAPKTLRTKDRMGTDAAVETFSRAMDAWYRRAVASAVRPDNSVNIDDMLPELRAIVDSGLTTIFRAGAVETLQDTGLNGPFSLIRQDAIDFLRSRGGELITSISGTLKDNVTALVVRGQEAGLSHAEIQASIQSEGLADWSAERIARTEASMAYNTGARIASAEAGFTGKVFDLAGESCAICQAIYDKYGDTPVPIADPYYRAGESVSLSTGGTYTFEQDAMQPPFHPNCRCAFIATMLPAGDRSAT